MTAACPFGVIGVNAALFKRRQGVFHKAGFVECVGVDRDLHIILLCHTEAVINGRRRGAPVFVEFKPHGPGFQLRFQRFRQAGVAFA